MYLYNYYYITPYVSDQIMNKNTNVLGIIVALTLAIVICKTKTKMQIQSLRDHPDSTSLITIPSTDAVLVLPRN